jgi:DNA-binding HxlR family transcriptional regulator
MAGGKASALFLFEILSKKWTLLVLRNLVVNKKRRFNELVTDLSGISPKTLSERLRELEKEGFLNKKPFAEIPPRVEYSLTQKGKDLVGCFKHIENCALKWAD